MDSLASLLDDQKFVEPPEVAIIKDFVLHKFQSTVKVLVNDHQINIIANSAALAGALRPELYKLQEQLDTDKKLILRIG